MMKMQKWRTAALLLAALLLLTPLLTPAHAWAEGEETQPGTETGVNANTLKIYGVDPSNEMSADLSKTDVVIDVYQVGDAKKQTRDDAYDYSFTGDFSKLQLADKMDRDKWNALAQEAAVIVEGKDITCKTITAGAPTEGEDNSLPDGVFLLIARNKTVTAKKEYLGHERPTKEEKEKDPDAAGAIYSIVNSKEYEYHFAPQLVVLPGKANLTEKDQTVMSSDPGAWIRDLTVYLKPVREDRMVDLKIIKTLTEFVGPEDGAAFVFEITATKKVEGKEEPQTVFSRVVQLSFTEEGEKVLLLEKVIPVGSEVTVKEIYPDENNKTYRLIAGPEEPFTAVADEIITAEFTNGPGEEFKPGQGVVNRFTKDESGDWPWEQIKDESEPKS